MDTIATADKLREEAAILGGVVIPGRDRANPDLEAEKWDKLFFLHCYIRHHRRGKSKGNPNYLVLSEVGKNARRHDVEGIGNQENAREDHSKPEAYRDLSQGQDHSTNHKADNQGEEDIAGILKRILHASIRDHRPPFCKHNLGLFEVFLSL
jgi:hypothetical protein|tara:strand:- start:502 stop:957 length:456 start_codon:yes stop_codon:yes gene_type:complete